MPRRSAASFSVLSYTGTAPRLSPPPELVGKARDIFLDTVAALKPGHFEPSDRPLLVEFCRAAALAGEADAALAAGGAVITGDKGPKVNPWLIVQEKAQRAMTALALRLRLYPQGRAPTVPTRPVPANRQISYFERMELEGVRDAPSEDGEATGDNH